MNGTIYKSNQSTGFDRLHFCLDHLINFNLERGDEQFFKAILSKFEIQTDKLSVKLVAPNMIIRPPIALV